ASMKFLSRGGLRIAAAPLAPAPLFAEAQSAELHLRYNSGQSVVPGYEGWERLPRGSFNIVVGYIYRNPCEELSLPGGARKTVLRPVRPIAASRRISTRAKTTSCSR